MLDPSFPFFFALATASEAFGPQHLIHETETGSLPIFDFNITHDEGQASLLTLEVLNPKRSLLASDQIYCWFSFRDGSSVEPFFHGRLVGSPSDLLGEVIKLEFIGEAFDTALQKQRLAETLKVPPNYDAIFIDQAKRDDPDTVLEGYSKLWHFDRVTGVVSVSDVLVGEDGIEVFSEFEVPYDSVKFELGSAPTSRIAVSADVNWTQTADGNLSFGTERFSTWAGQGLLNEWPKPLANLGSGWSVKTSSVTDLSGIDKAIMYSAHSSWQNQEKEHAIGDVMSLDVSISKPLLLTGTVLEAELLRKTQIGFIDPDPDTKDIQPESIQVTTLYIPKWEIEASLTLHWEARRPRTERIAFTLAADLQLLLPPAEFQAEETITKSGGDVGAPLLQIKNWPTVQDSDVTLGQIIYTAYPDGTLPNSYQMAANAGHTGTSQPTFPTDVGLTTTDGTVTWISLGPNFSIVALDWTQATFVRVGQLLLPEVEDWAYWVDLVPPPRINGVSIFEGTIVRASDNSSFHICTQSGASGLTEPSWPTTYGAVTTDGDVDWTCLGTTLPDGSIYFIATNSGETNANYLPNFNTTIGADTVDNTVIWRCLGLASDFAPLPIVDRSRRSYFPTARGLDSLEYLISVARAHLRFKARAVTVAFEIPFERALALSCRKSATITDDRLPGGTATGKIISYAITGNGDSGEYLGQVSIGCAIGRGGSVSDRAGTDAYVEAGTIEDPPTAGDGISAFPTSDVGYAQPIDAPADDGLVFPLTTDQVIIVNTVRGDPAVQLAAVQRGVLAAQQLALLEEMAHQNLPPAEYVLLQQRIAALSKKTVEAELAKPRNTLWKDLQLKPVASGPFETVYNVTTTKLVVPNQISIENASA